jgi:hypothetical protein
LRVRKSDAWFAREVGYRLAERRLHDVQRAGRLAEALRFGHRLEVAQVSWFHGSSVIASRDHSDRNYYATGDRFVGILDAFHHSPCVR